MTNLKLLSFHSQLASNGIKTPHAAQPMSFGKSIKKAKPVSLTPRSQTSMRPFKSVSQ